MESSGAQVLMARRPLFDAQRRVHGYDVCTEGTTGTNAPVSQTALDILTGTHQAFVSISETTLLSGGPEGLTPGQVVIKLPGTISAAPAVREACADLRRRGFQIALDGFVPAAEVSPLMRYVDFLLADAPHVSDVVHRPMPTLRATRPPAVMALNVETPDAFAAAAALGCVAFQGDFISRPRLTATSNIPPARVTALRLLRALQNPELSVVALEDLIKPDAAFCLRVLRAVNGPGFGQQSRITSLRQALLLVGTTTVREWATQWAVSQFSQQAPAELVLMASMRGRFCELLAKGSMANTGGDAFLLGMCSLLDAILESPMPAILKHLPLPEAIDAALRGEQNAQREMLDCAIAYEHGQFDVSRRLAADAGLDVAHLAESYRGAVQWIGAFQQVTAAA